MKTPTFKFFALTAFCCLSISTANGQDAGQLAFSDLQARANQLVEKGQLVQAIPLLKELVDRVGKAEDAEIELDFPLFLLGTAHLQQFVSTGNTATLNEAIKWYDKLEKDYPQSSRLKDALLKKVDAYRVLDRSNEAIKLMQRLLTDDQFRLSYPEQIKLLKDLTQTYYATGQLKEGLPYFNRLLETSRDPEEQALAAAASFESLFESKRMDDAITLLPYLVLESETRYRPRLNVALLKASDTLAEADRINDATLLLNLIKTTDLMIDFHEAQLAERQSTLQQRKAFGNSADVVQRLEQEIETLEKNLTQLRKLPTLRNELLTRRARNYTKSERRYEAFWMFYDLMINNPKDAQAEYFHYASFSNALSIGKKDAVIFIGNKYRDAFPEGEYYSDVTIALANELKNNGQPQEFLEIANEYLSNRPIDAASSSIFAQWASYLIEEGEYKKLVEQARAWQLKHDNPIYADGVYYWSGLAQLQLADFENASENFETLLTYLPTSTYAEDALLRKGTAQYYAQKYEESRQTLYAYVDKYPQGSSLDQAYYFLGEVETIAGDIPLAIQHFTKADSITVLQDIHDGVAFRLGSLYESMQDYAQMGQTFINYVETYGSEGRITDAIFELGRSYEFQSKPTEMLELYAEYIEKYITVADNFGVDSLIEGYSEKYTQNLKMLEETVVFLDRLDSDPAFREQIVTDRGFLFEYFYTNQTINQPLYNNLRGHPNFGKNLIKDLSPISDITTIFREQLGNYPKQTPEALFNEQLAKHRASNDRTGEVRSLMGLYRSGVETAPKTPFDLELIELSSPRVILYIADYERQKNLDLAIKAWNHLLVYYPQSDSTIVALLRLADVNEERGENGQALDYLETILTQFPGSPKTPAVILRQGAILTSIGRTAEAREKYQYLLKVPDWRGVIHARALYQTGESYMAESAYPEAHGFFERTFLGYSHFAEWSARAYLADADALVKMGAQADAITTLQEAVDGFGDATPSDLAEAIRNKLEELQS